MAETDPQDTGDDVFEQLMASVDPPMYVLTAHDGERRSGCLVGFAAQVSIRPARFMVMVSKTNHTYPVASAAPAVVVHVLRSSDHEMAARFGELSGDDVDKFDGLDVIEGPGRSPIVVGLDWFAGRVLQQIDLGDHVGLVLAPHDGSAARSGEAQLGMRDVDDLEPGHDA